MIVLRNKEFARTDYAGLTPENAKLLQQRRSELARRLRQNIKDNKEDFKGMDLAIRNTKDRRAAQNAARTYRQDLLKEQRDRATRQFFNKKKEEAFANKLRAQAQGRIKNLKTAGKIGLGIAGTAAIGYGIKKAVDKNKKEKEHN